MPPAPPRLPTWTWIAPLLICHLGTQASLAFQFAPGVALLYLPIPLAMAMIQWWGPRVLLGVFVNATLSAGLWGLPRMALWPVYALPETLGVAASWALWRLVVRKPLDLPGGEHTLRWVLLAIVPAACFDGFQVPGQMVLLGDLPAAEFWRCAWGEWTGTLLAGFSVATPLLYVLSPALERRGWSQTQFSPTPAWIPPQRQGPWVKLELSLLVLLPVTVSPHLPVDDFWFAYAILGLWTALRFGLGLGIMWNGWAMVVALVVPLLSPLDDGVVAESRRALTHTHMGLVLICAVTLVTGSTVQVMLRELEARARSEASLLLTRFSVDHTSEAIFWMDVHGRFVDVNLSACASLDYTRAELLQMSVPDIDPEFPAARWAETLELLQRKGHLKMESVHRTRSGTLKPVDIVANYITFGDQERICAFVRDISARNEARARLMQSEARFRTLVENAPDAIVVLDMGAGRFVDFNKNACRLFELDEDELRKRGPVELSPARQPNGRPSAEMALEKLSLAVAGESPQFEWTHVSASGKEMVCDLRLTRLPSAERILVRGSITDITQRRRLENELYKAQKLESLGILAGGIAHDFNNLIGGIYGYLDLAQSVAEEPRVAKYLDRAVQSIDRARGLTQQLLTFARGGEPIKEAQRLDPFLVDTTRFALSGSKVSCEFDLPADLWVCEFDRSQIAQVVDNLVINAMQAMPDGGVVSVAAANVWVRGQQHGTLSDGAYVRISIKDRGVGISPTHLAHIFDPFFTTKSKGHGLGLATCYSIMTRHRGRIDVASEVGVGTTFSLYLPASQEGVAVAAPEPEAALSGAGRFIVMDDDPAIRETLSAMLEALGFEPVVCEDGREAIAALRADLDSGRPVSGMLFDLTVPGQMGGVEAVAIVRTLDPAIPVFVASGYAQDPVMAHPTDYGFTASICKPFLKADLARLMKHHRLGDAG